MSRTQPLFSSMKDDEIAALFQDYRWEIVGPPPF
jgi:hypothetical protein